MTKKENRAERPLGETLTDDEKLRLIMGKNWWETDDLGGKLPSVKVSDGPLGLRCLAACTDWSNSSVYPSVAYPCAQMLAQTWDTELAYLYGAAIADDCAELGVDIILGPGCNIKRSPLNGRNFEYYSEDPYISGVFAEQFIRGAQEGGIGVALKHYACNSVETARRWRSSEVAEDVMREIYLRAFEIACRAEPMTVMSSYNLVNGVRMAENRRLFDILRREFGFDGMIMSDWEVVQDVRRSLNAGLDWEMPYHAGHAEERRELLAAGELDLQALDASAGRVAAVAEKVRENRRRRRVETSVEERIAFSQRVEENAIVLLKNSGVLPLTGDALVTGYPAANYTFGGGSSAVIPNRPFVPLDEALRAEGVAATYAQSIVRESVWETVGDLFSRAQAADVTVVCIGEGSRSEYESRDRRDLSVSPEETELLRYLRKYSRRLVVLVYAGAPLDLKEIDNYADAVVLVGFGGQNVSQAVAGVLSGRVCPSGRLTETWALSLSDIPAVQSPVDEEHVYYTEGRMVGYRYFTTADKPVLYPFGYGLSYTEFSLEDFTVECGGETVTVGVTVQNTGVRAGADVVQVYVRRCNAPEGYPVRELRAFGKVMLASGEQRRMTFVLTNDDFSYYTADGTRVYPQEIYAVEIGENADEILMSKMIQR